MTNDTHFEKKFSESWRLITIKLILPGQSQTTWNRSCNTIKNMRSKQVFTPGIESRYDLCTHFGKWFISTCRIYCSLLLIIWLKQIETLNSRCKCVCACKFWAHKIIVPHFPELFQWLHQTETSWLWQSFVHLVRNLSILLMIGKMSRTLCDQTQIFTRKHEVRSTKVYLFSTD